MIRKLVSEKGDSTRRVGGACISDNVKTFLKTASKQL